MTAVASPPSFQQNNRQAWGVNGGLNAQMNADEVARMFMPRKSAQRANSSSSISSLSSTSSASSTGTVVQSSPSTNGASTVESNNWGTAAARKKTQRTAPWPTGKAEPLASVSVGRPQSILTNGTTPNAIHQSNTTPQVTQNPTQQANGVRPPAQPVGEGNPVLYLLSMNGTFERKTISVPFYPDSLRIGRQTNAKTVPTPANGFFDSKVLSRQHAEIWGDRNGKVWIRDVKSSNGTFVNGARLSAENRDSEPHELQSQDHLELGIDIVSEDQKTVVHHKVAAKVEHAGYIGSTNNILDMNFGDLDPANGAMMVPCAGSMQMRGRTGIQGSIGSSSRVGPPASGAGSHQRPMNFWLTPVTTEQIVKRLTLEMRTARLQMNDLGRTDKFIDSLLSKEHDMQQLSEAPKAPLINGSPLPYRIDSPRFSDPPAPPPQQPLPEKPDVVRLSPVDTASPLLKRTNTERLRSVPSVSPILREQNSSQIITLVEALASAKKEIDTQGARLRDLEEMLQKERQARELAEEVAKRLELESESKMNGHAISGESILDEAFDPPPDVSESDKDVEVVEEKTVDPVAISDSSSQLEKRIETMLVDMREMRDQMDSFRKRAEVAEAERDCDRKTLAEMVDKIRAEESARRSSSTERARSPSGELLQGSHEEGIEGLEAALSPFLKKASLTNGSTRDPSNSQGVVGILSKQSTGHDPLLYHTTPYASMVGVVLIGMGLMAYLNGWQQPPRVDR